MLSRFSACDSWSRESSDHASFNSWDRQVYMYDAPDGSTAVRKLWDSNYGNFIFANYHSSMAVDNDDGRREHARDEKTASKLTFTHFATQAIGRTKKGSSSNL